MNYLVTARAARLVSGVLTLTEAQASARGHALTGLGDGEYQIAAPVEFKAGEVIGYAGDLPKILADILVDPAAIPAAAQESAGNAKPTAKPKKAKPAAHSVTPPAE